MSRVIYTVEFGIDVAATTKTLALHEAGSRWPALEEHLQHATSDITIRSIKVEPSAAKPDGAAEEDCAWQTD